MTHRRFQINPGPLRIRGSISEPEYRQRHYKAWKVACPCCHAAPGAACHSDGHEMRGVHRERNLAFNRARCL